MDYLLEYDETSPCSIESYSQQLIGKTFSDIIHEGEEKVSLVREGSNYGITYSNKKHKGGLGQLLEECFFHYKCNNNSKPDFDKAGVELKVTPYKINKNNSFSAKERLIITMIDYMNVHNETFDDSHLWIKSKLILLVYYLYQQDVENKLDYKIDYVKLFGPPEKDLNIMRQDFELIQRKIKAGKAHELSGSDTLYLEAATKATISSARRPQPFSEIPAKPRAFAFKNSYMTYVLNKFIVPGKVSYEPIIKDEISLPFEEYVAKKINAYRHYSIEDICNKFMITFEKHPKNLEAMLAYRILGISGNNAEEFQKANIVVKTIRISHNNKIKESMSFPAFKFKELVEEEWDTSTFGTYLSETRFLFIVYKFDDENVLRLKGCQFWNIPYHDLNEEVRSVWEQTKLVLIEGLKVTSVNGRNTSNLPKASENTICHVRPHARNSDDTYELPTGRNYPKQCFWLNNTYILSQLNPDLIT